MSAVDFGAWAIPDLVLTLGGRTYNVPPPSLDRMRVLLALAVRGEVQLKLVKGEIPPEVQQVLDAVAPGDHPALSQAVYEQMVADEVNPVSIDRMSYYAIFYWARGKQYADALAAALFTPREDSSSEASGSDPKARPTSPRKSGRGTGSATRSTTTRTASRSSRTTAPLADS